jgi:hypothetical protein
MSRGEYGGRREGAASVLTLNLGGSRTATIQMSLTAKYAKHANHRRAAKSVPVRFPSCFRVVRVVRGPTPVRAHERTQQSLSPSGYTYNLGRVFKIEKIEHEAVQNSL